MGVGVARRSGWAEALVAGALVLALLSLLTGGLGWLTGAELLGAGTADLWGHALGYGQVARQVARGLAPGLDLPLRWPEGQRWWIIDLPVAVAVAPLTAGLGPMAATNAALAGHLVLGLRPWPPACGGAAWARWRRWVPGCWWPSRLIAAAPCTAGCPSPWLCCCCLWAWPC